MRSGRGRDFRLVAGQPGSTRLSESPGKWDSWAIPNLALWGVFFVIGLDPERVFWALRLASNVVIQDAWANSPIPITLALAGYLAFFTYQRCLEAGASPRGARARAAQVAALGLAAFFWVSPSTMVHWLYEIPVRSLRLAVYPVLAAKVLAWLYLYSLVLRHVGLGNHEVFARIVVLFPSVHLWSDEEEDSVEGISHTKSTPE